MQLYCKAQLLGRLSNEYDVALVKTRNLNKITQKTMVKLNIFRSEDAAVFGCWDLGLIYLGKTV